MKKSFGEQEEAGPRREFATPAAGAADVVIITDDDLGLDVDVAQDSGAFGAPQVEDEDSKVVIEDEALGIFKGLGRAATKEER